MIFIFIISDEDKPKFFLIVSMCPNTEIHPAPPENTLTMYFGKETEKSDISRYYNILDKKPFYYLQQYFIS